MRLGRYYGQCGLYTLSAFAKKYLDFRLKRYPLKDYPYKARLFDVLATTSLTEGECYDTAHECSRLETAEIRKEILDYARKNYRLDVHTEGRQNI